MRSGLRRVLLMLLAISILVSIPIIISYSQSINYYYDDLNGLMRMDYGDTVTDYSYDDVGNREEERIAHPPITTASPAGGPYGSAQSVTLACTDPQGPGCGNIYYTTDGSTPTTSSAVYSSAIAISATTTLKFFARDLSTPAVNETVKSHAYTIDTIPPTGSVVINSGASTTDNYNVTLTLTCSDNVGCSQMQFSNDNITFSTPEAFLASKSWPMEDWDGTKTVYARFKDTAGNWSNLYLDTIDLYNNPARPPIVIGGSNYTTLQAAYNAATTGATIKCRAVRFRESLTVNRNITVTLEGGYDSAFTSNAGGQTQVRGMISSTAGGGTMTIKNFVLEQ